MPPGHRAVQWLSLVLTLTCCKAQDTTTYTTDPATQTVAQQNTFTVAVGRGGHTFSPDVVQASVGDVIEFQFFPPNHSVVRSEYLLPCIPYEMTGPKVGFFSGFHPVDAILTDPPKWYLTINDTDPIFYYCSAQGSCTDWGMVGVINPNATTSLQEQKNLALNASFQLNPGEPWPAEATSSPPPGYTTTATETASPTTPTSAPGSTTSPSPSPEPSSHNSLSTGAIAGIAIGGAALLVAIGVLIWYCGRQSRQNKHVNTDAPPNYVPPHYNGYAQPMSPSAKHVSGITMSSAQPSPGFPGYPYDPNQGHMSPFGAVPPASPPHGPQQFFSHQQQAPPHMSPRSTAFGAPPPQMSETGAPFGASVVEADSERGSSPPPPPNPNSTAGGIEAFLARQGRMSPNHSGVNTNSGSSEGGEGPLIRGHVGSGPYEMSAGGTNNWR